MSAPLPPFSCTYSPSIPELLQNLNCSLAITTYQAGKVIFISPKDRDHLIQLPRQFAKPMGISLKGNKMALATLNQVIVFANSIELARTYPKQPQTYDTLFVPRAAYYTGELDLHDLQLTSNGLIAVNTRFSCLSYINEDFNFVPFWKPAFITTLTGDDQCHLNGVAMDGDSPRYVTVLGKTTGPVGWRANKANGGCLIEINSNEIVAEGLGMPHSPRIYNGKVYVLLSATGELAEIDTKNRSVKIIKRLDGFVRGMDLIGDYLFIGLSKLRQTSMAFAELPIAKQSVFCGIVALHLPTSSIVGHIRYQNSVEEIYDVRVLPGMQRPGILNTEKEDYKLALATPDKTFWAKATDPNEGA